MATKYSSRPAKADLVVETPGRGGADTVTTATRFTYINAADQWPVGLLEVELLDVEIAGWSPRQAKPDRETTVVFIDYRDGRRLGPFWFRMADGVIYEPVEGETPDLVHWRLDGPMALPEEEGAQP